MLRPQQKSLFVMNALVDKYSQPGDLVYDTFACSYETGCACTLLPLYLRFILGDNDEDCRTFEMMQLVEVFARQFLSYDSDISVPPEIQDAATFLTQLRDEINVKKYSTLWDSFPGYSVLQLFPPEVIHSFCSLHKDYSIHRYSLQIARNQYNLLGVPVSMRWTESSPLI